MTDTEGSDRVGWAHPICPVADCILDIDLVLKASNDLIFGAHKRNLELYSEGFPIAQGTSSDNEVIILSEGGLVLRLLLEFMHNTLQPDLSNLTFSTLALFAEAVEKYMVFSAMQVCKMHMEKAIKSHPFEVFLYAVKHNYGGLADNAAPSLVRVPLGKFLEDAIAGGLPANTIVHFIRYREHWSNVLHILYGDLPVVKHRGGSDTCDMWAEFYNAILLDVKLDASSLSQFSNTVEVNRDILDDCVQCGMRIDRVKKKIADAISAIPCFSQI